MFKKIKHMYIFKKIYRTFVFIRSVLLLFFFFYQRCIHGAHVTLKFLKNVTYATSPDTPSDAGSYVTSRMNQPSNFCGPPMAKGLGESRDSFSRNAGFGNSDG